MNKNPTIFISVIIVSYNTREVLRKCLQILLQNCNRASTEIFVVDNASEDNSAGMVETEFPQVKLIHSSINLGFGAANNAAFRRACGKYIVFLNSDVFLGRTSLTRSIEKMESHPAVALGGGKLLGKDGSLQPSGRIFPSLTTILLDLTGLSTKYPDSRFFGQFNRTWASSEKPAEVDWVPGAFAIVRKEVLDKIGMFDERFFLYYEEVDLCYRLKKGGYRVQYWPEIEVTHLGGESTKNVTHAAFSGATLQLRLWQVRSEFLYFRKHCGIIKVFVF